MLDYAVSLRPDYHRAILDTVQYYGWTNIIYMYDSHDGKYLFIFAMFNFKILVEFYRTFLILCLWFMVVLNTIASLFYRYFDMDLGNI